MNKHHAIIIEKIYINKPDILKKNVYHLYICSISALSLENICIQMVKMDVLTICKIIFKFDSIFLVIQYLECAFYKLITHR